MASASSTSVSVKPRLFRCSFLSVIEKAPRPTASSGHDLEVGDDQRGLHSAAVAALGIGVHIHVGDLADVLAGAQPIHDLPGLCIGGALKAKSDNVPPLFRRYVFVGKEVKL